MPAIMAGSDDVLDLSPTHGTWIGEEVLHPGPGIAQKLTARGVMSIRPAYGGRGTAGDYEQRIGGQTSVVAHTVVVPAGTDLEVLAHTTTPHNPPQTHRGEFRDGVLRLSITVDGKVQHLVQDFTTPGTLELRMTVGDSDDPVFEGSYRKVQPPSKTGTFGWHDLTVEDAPAVRDFYAEVVGWKSSGVSMGDYEDFAMLTPAGDAVGGVCHARGPNADLPATWLIYVHVDDLDASVATVDRLGGKLIARPRPVGDDRMAVIEDPAGAVIALYEAASKG